MKPSKDAVCRERRKKDEKKAKKYEKKVDKED